ncbi:hypothetical protein BDQ12DRAFT_186767 [Crucibulum laeve]|uniref:BTB domain-containing protein n=1 Tax=Crucibulum laeve TaxID=68775 RepID=A0A5C3MDT1_9AGAR|nr:hypothetical protein BDQ12DRAFT_186767 [Crucibulum laeve]
MDHTSPTDWDSVLQFVADPLELDFSKHSAHGMDKPMLNNGPFQVPTPPQSHDGTPAVEDPNDSNIVSVSTTFYPGAQHNSLPPDVVLLAADNVFFYVHSHVILSVSENGFRGQLPAPPPSTKDQDIILAIPETSTVLNVLLHAIYDMSCAHYSPTFATLVSAVSHLPLYGVRPKSRILPATPLFTLLLSHAPLFPLELYALSASFDLYDLAVSTSSHLLSFPLSSLTDEMAERIGPVYLKRLFFLHFGRSDALKRVLLPPPHPHAPTPWCDFTEQKKLTRAWALASAYLAWDARPDLSTSTMESALRPLAEHLTCDQCQHALRERIKNLVVQWSVVKRTI